MLDIWSEWPYLKQREEVTLGGQSSYVVSKFQTFTRFLVKTTLLYFLCVQREIYNDCVILNFLALENLLRPFFLRQNQTKPNQTKQSADKNE